MSPGKSQETYYEILKVDPKATIAEIVQAYHTAKNAFSRDSIATYSLFSPDEAQAILNRLEEAYLNLSNIDKKRAYDSSLASSDGEDAALVPVAELEIHAPTAAAASLVTPQVAAPAPTYSETATVPETTVSQAPVETSTPMRAAVGDSQTITGSFLREIREKRSLSIDDVSRITKIPVKFIKAIELEDPKTLPARVYLQGFIKNMANLYKLEPLSAAKSYLENVDTKTQETRLRF